MRILYRLVCALVLLLLVGVPVSATADTITIGTVEYGPCCIEFGTIPGTNTEATLIGTSANVTNSSPVVFSDIELWVILDIVNPPDQSGDVCESPSLAPGGSFACASGPLLGAPLGPGLMQFSALILGNLTQASFVLPGGDLFTADSLGFQASGGGLAAGTFPIQITGTRTVTPVPEPSTLSLVAFGLTTLALNRQRRRRWSRTRPL